MEEFIKTCQYKINLDEENIKKIKYFDTILSDSVASKSDINGNIICINENFTKVTGYTKEECLGKNHNILKHPDNPPLIYDKLWQTLKEGKIFKDRMLNKNKDGSEFWAATTIIPLKNDCNEIVEYLCLRDDITSMLTFYRSRRKELEEAKITKAKESFLILFTHELKTPLNAIINFSGYLLRKLEQKKEVDADKQQNLLSKIEQSANLMLENITQLLELSKLKSNKLTYSKTYFNPSKAVEDVLESHKSLAKQRGVKISFKGYCNDFLMLSDLFRFKQILANIFSNAIKYSNRVVQISVYCELKKFCVIVEDDGEGVENPQNIFELFEQGGGDIHKKGQTGTGVGLYLVKLLCNDLGFAYEVEKSQSLGGLKFKLTKVID